MKADPHHPGAEIHIVRLSQLDRVLIGGHQSLGVQFPFERRQLLNVCIGINMVIVKAYGPGNVGA